MKSLCIFILGFLIMMATFVLFGFFKIANGAAIRLPRVIKKLVNLTDTLASKMESDRYE